LQQWVLKLVAEGSKPWNNGWMKSLLQGNSLSSLFLIEIRRSERLNRKRPVVGSSSVKPTTVRPSTASIRSVSSTVTTTATAATSRKKNVTTTSTASKRSKTVKAAPSSDRSEGVELRYRTRSQSKVQSGR
jgi:hypothetical protein